MQKIPTETGSQAKPAQIEEGILGDIHAIKQSLHSTSMVSPTLHKFDSSISLVNEEYNFCYRISTHGSLIERTDESLKTTKPKSSSTLLFQEHLREEEVLRIFPSRCIIYVNVFRHPRSPKPIGTSPESWTEIPIALSGFDHHQGSKVVKISAIVCLNNTVIENVVKPKSEMWAILNQQILIQLQKKLDTTWNIVYHHFKDRAREPFFFYEVDRQMYTIRVGYKDSQNSRKIPHEIKTAATGNIKEVPASQLAFSEKKFPLPFNSTLKEPHTLEEIKIKLVSKKEVEKFTHLDELKEQTQLSSAQSLSDKPTLTSEIDKSSFSLCMSKPQNLEKGLKDGQEHGDQREEIATRIARGFKIEQYFASNEVVLLKLILPSLPGSSFELPTIEVCHTNLKVECITKNGAKAIFKAVLDPEVNFEEAKAWYCKLENSLLITSTLDLLK